MRPAIACFKIFLFLILSVLTIPVQAICNLFPARTNIVNIVSNFYGRSVCKILCVKVNIIGAPASSDNIIFVGNHLSYADIGVIGGHLKASFISKAEIRNWPVFGILATLSKTVFIERHRNAAAKAISQIKKTLLAGQNLILFPEGTSTNGLNVLPFKSSVFELFLSDQLKDCLTVQPFTVTITHVDGHPVQRPNDNDLYAWYGDEEFSTHLWRLAKSKGAQILLSLHSPRKAADYNDRKQFALDCYKDVAKGLKNTLPAPLDFQGKAA